MSPSSLRLARGWWFLLPGLALAVVAAALAVPVTAQSPVADTRVDVLIGFGDAPGQSDEALVRAAGGAIRHRFRLVPAIAARMPQPALAALRANPSVTVIEPDVRVFAIDAELDASWGVKRIGGGAAHQGGITGAGVTVAVLDSGMDYAHPDLAASYAGGYDFVNGDADPFDDYSHGTHVAGTIAARDDGAGVVGVAPDARILVLKVLDAAGSGAFSDVVAALEWALANGAQIANHSYGSYQDPGTLVQQAFDNAEAAGLLHVAAAGNSGTCAGTGDNVGFPARYLSVMAVAATDATDVSPCFSSTGPDVELSGPGVAVNSTVPGGYQVKSGTSMASPHVAGVAALVLGQGQVVDANGNGRVNDEIRQHLIATSQDLGNPGHDTWYGYGLVDAVAATGTPVARDPAVSASVSASKSTYLKGVDISAVLTVVVKDENGADIVGLAPARFSTTLNGVATPAEFLPVGSGRYAGSVALSSLAPGTHAVSVVVTDPRGVAGSASTSFALSLSVKAQSIGYSVSGPASKRTLSIVVTVVDPAGGTPLQGATVTIHVAKNGAAYYGLTATSNRSGTATFSIKNAPSACYTTAIAGIAIVGRIWDQSTPPNQYCY